MNGNGIGNGIVFCREITSVRFSLDGKTILSASRDSTIKLWSSESGACTKTLTGHLEYENGKREMEVTDWILV